MTQLNALSKSKQQHLHRTLNPVQTTRWKKKVQGLFFSLGPTGHQIKTTVKIYMMTLGAHMLHNFYRMPAHCMRSQLWARMPRPASASCNSISAWVQCSCITFMSDSKGNRVPPWCRESVDFVVTSLWPRSLCSRAGRTASCRTGWKQRPSERRVQESGCHAPTNVSIETATM